MPWYIDDGDKSYEVPDDISQNDDEAVNNYLTLARRYNLDTAEAKPAEDTRAMEFGKKVLPAFEKAQEVFPESNPYGNALEGFVLGSAPASAKKMAEGETNVLANTKSPNPLDWNIKEEGVDMAGALPLGLPADGAKGAMFVAHGLPKDVLEKIVSKVEKKYAGQPLAKDLTKYELWDDYKLFQDRAGDWKTEVSDLPGKFKDDMFFPTLKETGKVFKGKLGSVYQHEELFKQYPELKDIDVEIHPYKDKIMAGSFWKNKLTLYTDDADVAKPTVLHELQHAIQEKEGWSKGANPEQSKDYLLKVLADQKSTFSNAFANRLTELGIDKELQDFLTQGTVQGSWYDKVGKFINSDLINDAELLAYFNGIKKTSQIQGKTMRATGHDIYNKSLGEMEARNTELRALLEQANKEYTQETGLPTLMKHPLDTEEFQSEKVWSEK